MRYHVPWKHHTIEIDIYRGRYDGLVVAEVEFDDQRSCVGFEPPDWLGYGLATLEPIAYESVEANCNCGSTASRSGPRFNT
jgi:CYTH domain-containing protein